MSKAILVIVGLSLILGLAQGAVECPDGCACYNDFATVKCRDTPLSDLPRFDKHAMAKVAVLDMTGCRVEVLKELTLSHFPKLKRLILKNNIITRIESRALERAPLLSELDLRGNELKSLPSGIFSNSRLKVLFLEKNPFSCDPSTVHILHTEILALMSEDTNLQMFDGGYLECADPSNLKAQKIIYLPDKVIRTAFMRSGGPDTMGFSGLTLAGVALITFLLTALCAAGFILWNKRVLQKKDNVSSMEEGESLIELNTQTEHSQPEYTLVNTLHTLRRKSQGYPSGDIIDSADEDAVEPETYIKEKMEQQRRHSLGYPQGDHSSNEAMEEINLNSSE